MQVQVQVAVTAVEMQVLPVQAAARPDVEVAAPSQDHAGWTAKLRAAVTLLTPQCISLCLGRGRGALAVATPTACGREGGRTCGGGARCARGCNGDANSSEAAATSCAWLSLRRRRSRKSGLASTPLDADASCSDADADWLDASVSFVACLSLGADACGVAGCGSG